MTREEKAKEYLEKYEDAESTGRKVYWTKAECLYQWEKDNLYQLLFDGAGTWKEFCSNLKVPSSSASQKIHNWKFFVIKHSFRVADLEGFDTSCLYYICRKLENFTKSEIKSSMDLSKRMSRDDFIATITGQAACPHSETQEITETVEKCLLCGRKIHTP